MHGFGFRNEQCNAISEVKNLEWKNGERYKYCKGLIIKRKSKLFINLEKLREQ